ncbi:MAG: serpin family protein [Eubacteriales bacterium]|nr:serpin family protein [Eubacteriales bacterium]
MKKIVFCVIALIFLLAGCVSASAIGYEATLSEQSIQALDEDFAKGVNAFGFDAANLLYDTGSNLALSPVSIELALLMTRTGASGDTAGEISAALSQSGQSDDDITSACRSLMWRANTGGMETANSIWLSDTYTFRDGFIDTCLNDFMADAMPLEIPGATDEINAWISENTHGKIDKLLDEELPEETRIVLCNALYYLGEWVQPFEANDTFDEEFTTPGSTVTAPFMHSAWSVPYYENGDFSMISLDFKSEEDEGEYAMALLLPKEGSDLSDMLTCMNSDTFSAALDALETQQVSIKIPKFEYSFFTPLKDTLDALGMRLAFSFDADFSAMTDTPNEIYIEEVLHKCYIRVDELGAEAAAATEVIALDTAIAPEPDPATFYADRPFLFAIYSKEDGTIAFMGAVNDPTQE